MTKPCNRDQQRRDRELEKIRAEIAELKRRRAEVARLILIVALIGLRGDLA